MPEKKLKKRKSKGNGKHPGGAPKKYDVDTVKLLKLAKIGLTVRECADVLGCPENVISGSYQDIYTKGREKLKERLRLKQIKKALEGNVVMLIWLGKQYLEQKDKQDITSNDKTLTAVEVLIRKSA
jgi:hypothetical protein